MPTGATSTVTVALAVAEALTPSEGSEPVHVALIVVAVVSVKVTVTKVLAPGARSKTVPGARTAPVESSTSWRVRVRPPVLVGHGSWAHRRPAGPAWHP